MLETTVSQETTEDVADPESTRTSMTSCSPSPLSALANPTQDHEALEVPRDRTDPLATTEPLETTDDLDPTALPDPVDLPDLQDSLDKGDKLARLDNSVQLPPHLLAAPENPAALVLLDLLAEMEILETTDDQATPESRATKEDEDPPAATAAPDDPETPDSQGPPAAATTAHPPGLPLDTKHHSPSLLHYTIPQDDGSEFFTESIGPSLSPLSPTTILHLLHLAFQCSFLTHLE